MSSSVSSPWAADLSEHKRSCLDRDDAPSATAYVLNRLRADILAAHFSPGAKLPLKILIDRYKTSVVPIREALAVLCGAGLAVSECQRGFRVAAASREDFTDVAEMRRRLETLALRMSIERADADWEKEVKEASEKLARISQKVGQDGPISDEWELLHRQFHFALIECCGSRSLLDFCFQLYDRYDRYRRLALPSKSYMAGVAADNDEIVAAAVGRHVDSAVALLERHIEAMTDVILEVTRFAPGRFMGPAVCDPRFQHFSARDRHDRRVKMASTSTAAFPGSAATPTAVRACRPDSPNSAMKRSEAPLMTAGGEGNPGTQFTNPPTRRHSAIRSRLPSEASRR
jgi:GntR family transcriptional regulator, carbon starvation induced regulator